MLRHLRLSASSTEKPFSFSSCQRREKYLLLPILTRPPLFVHLFAPNKRPLRSYVCVPESVSEFFFRKSSLVYSTETSSFFNGRELDKGCLCFPLLFADSYRVSKLAKQNLNFAVYKFTFETLLNLFWNLRRVARSRLPPFFFQISQKPKKKEEKFPCSHESCLDNATLVAVEKKLLILELFFLWAFLCFSIKFHRENERPLCQ